MDEKLLKYLANKELKQTVLNEAKKILWERNKNGDNAKEETQTKTNVIHKKDKKNEEEKWENCENCENSNNDENENENENETIKGQERKEDLYSKENIVLIEKEKENSYIKTNNTATSYLNLQQFSVKYSEMYQIYDLSYGNMEYELLISFIKTASNEMNYHLNHKNMNKYNGQDDDILHKMVKVFIEKLIFYCTTPVVVFSQNSADTNGLFDVETTKHVNNLFNKLEGYNGNEHIFKNCILDILMAIFNFKPNPNDFVSWITRQGFVDLIKIIIGNSSKRAQLCTIYAIDLIKKKFEHLDFFQVDNILVIIEIMQYAIITIVEKKKRMETFLFKEEEWYKQLCELIQLLKNSEWPLLFKQLLVIQSYLYAKKRQHFNKNFNEWYNNRIEMVSIRNCSYSRLFKIEMPISISMFKQLSP